MTLRQLELFVAVVETKSFSRGAEHMALTQSTVSQHIAALEEEFGTQLLDRTSKGILLTATGKVFLQHARRILAERDILNEAMISVQGLEHATLHLGASNIPANCLVPRLLPVIHRKYPGIVLNMRIGDSREILEELRSGHVELAIVGGQINDDIYHYEPLLTDHLVMIVGPKHPFKDRRSISLEELSGQSIITREDGSGTHQALQNSFIANGVDPNSFKVIACLGSNEAVRRAVSTGMGCAFVSDLSIQTNLKHGELFKVDIKGLKIERQFWLAKLKERSASPAALAVMDLLHQRDSFDFILREDQGF